MRLRVQTAGITENLPAQTCPVCYQELTSTLTQGAKLRAEEMMKDQNRKILWKNRVSLIREGKLKFQRKAFSEAAILFEKYLRILEIVHDVPAGGLTPEIFSRGPSSRELTVITSVYWDLFRIYDASPRYGDRQSVTMDKLCLFLPKSEISKEVLRQADAFRKNAKNEGMVLELMKRGKYRAACFVATAAFENELTPEVQKLYRFRDQVLETHPVGQRVVNFYYVVSPSLAQWVIRSPLRKKASRKILTTFVNGFLKDL